jgi:phospholipase C
MKHARAAKRCLLAASALTTLTLAWLSPGLAATAQTATPIRHVVVLYMENHSFDNVLGFWCDRNPGRCPLGGMPPTVRLSNGAVIKPSVAPDTVPFVNHNVATQLAAMNIQSGVPRMNGWQNIPDGSCDAATHYQCVSGYQPSQIPNLAKLAQDFAISDGTFSMGDSPSWGGHLYAAMSSLDGFMGDNPVPAPGTSDSAWGCNHTSVTPWLSSAGREKWILTYDDCGCFYDQVPPGVNADGTWRGPRIPLVIVSPYAKAGFTDSTPTTFAGILAYVEHTFGLSPLGANDASAYDFRHAFNYAQTPRRPARMVTRPLPPSARHIRLTPALLNDPT